jgi:hypothetical protein
MAWIAGLLAEQWPEVPVHGVLCFVGAEWTRVKPKNVDGVVVIWPKALAAHVSANGPPTDQVTEIAHHLRTMLRQA